MDINGILQQWIFFEMPMIFNGCLFMGKSSIIWVNRFNRYIPPGKRLHNYRKSLV